MFPGCICLQIEGGSVFCEKQVLIANSDYFRAMFEGNFIESRKRVIKLDDVDLKSMHIILALLLNESLPIETEDILMVLQTACMLQFEKIRQRCIEQIIEMLCPINCLKIWLATEKLQIRPLFLHAKAMALEEFLIVKDTNDIFDLTLEEIYYYLGHRFLKTDTEFSVFQTAMNWWYRNYERYVEYFYSLVKLLSCIHWPRVFEYHLNEMITYLHIADEDIKIIYVLCCILLIQKNERTVEGYSPWCQRMACSFLAARRRGSPKVPCILAHFVKSKNKTKIPKEKEHTVIYYDKFKRKRFYQILDNSKNDNLTAVFYDYKVRKFKRYFDFDGEKCIGLEGFGLSGYRRYVFFYGGEYVMGRGVWNFNLWTYDVIRETWDRKDLLPIRRRHFQTCIAGDNLFIIGGNGTFRVIQDNMIWYNFTLEMWSPVITLPFPSIQSKCCSFLNKLLILNLSAKLGYLFDSITFNWYKIEIFIHNIDDILSTLSDYFIFSYNNLLYIKGNHLIVCSLKDLKIQMVTLRYKIKEHCDKLEIVVCDNIVYTMYQNRSDETDFYTLETYDLDTGYIDYVFKDKPSYEEIEIDGNLYTISSSFKMFSFEHHGIIEDNKVINNVESIF